MIKIETVTGKSLYKGDHVQIPVVGETIWVNFSDYKVISVEKHYFTIDTGKTREDTYVKVEAAS